MKFVPTDLPGVIRIEPVVHRDDRGYFMETWRAQSFADHGVSADFVQDDFSHSIRGTLRGLHYQIEQAQGKLVRVTHGEVFDVAVDLRKSSPHYGQWIGEVLSAENRHQFWIPPGFGHGFLVLSETASIEYRCTDYYAPESGRSVRWDDPDLGIEWPLTAGELPTLSAKDAAAPLLKDADTYA